MSSLNDKLKTDVNVYRLRASAGRHGVVFAWDYPGSDVLRVRIVRAGCGEGHAAPEPPAGSPWKVVYDGATGSFRDTGVTGGATYRYAVFARRGDGPWTLWRTMGLVGE